MDLHEKYQLRRVINACGKMTALGGSRVLPEIIEPVAESLGCFFELDELQAAAGKVIAQASGAESGCVTAWTAEQDRRVQMIIDSLSEIPGLQLGIDPDPNGCPFSRARLTPDLQLPVPHSP